MNNVIMSANELENCLTEKDNKFLHDLEQLYKKLEEPSLELDNPQ